MRKVLFSIGAGIASVALLAGCSTYVEQESIETDIATQAEEQLGMKAEVSCSDDLPGELDAQIECELSIPEMDETGTIEVTVTSVNDDTNEVEYEWVQVS